MPYKTFPDVVNNLALFSGIPELERNQLLQEGQLRHVARGGYLFHHGDPVERFYIICRGNMQLVRETPDGKEITTAVKSRGKTIGKVEILKTFKHHTLSACAVTDVDVLEFSAEWLRKIASHPVIALNILTTISQYAHMVEVEAEQKSTMSVAQRVGCFLQRLCVMHGFDPRGFDLPYSKVIIASRLGMEPETLSRALGALREQGVKVENNRVSFYDMRAVEDFVCEHCSMVGDCPTHKKLSHDH